MVSFITLHLLSEQEFMDGREGTIDMRLGGKDQRGVYFRGAVIHISIFLCSNFLLVAIAYTFMQGARAVGIRFL